MNIDKVVEQLREKYEYLDFEDKKIAKKVELAIKESGQDSNFLFSSVEYSFLNHLIDILKEGDRDVFDALVIAFREKADFVFKRRLELSGNLTKEEKEELCEEALTSLIDSYRGSCNVVSAYTQNLISLMRSRKNKVDGQVQSLQEKLISKYGDINVSILKLTISYIRDNHRFNYDLLTKKYGEGLIGSKTTLPLISYMELNQIEKIERSLYEDYLYAMQLNKENKTEEEILSSLKRKHSIQILDDTKNTKEKKNVTKKTFLQQYAIKEKDLADAIDFSNEPIASRAFKMTYGIGCSKLKPKQILQELELSNGVYLLYVRNITSALPNLIKEYREYMQVYIDNKKESKVFDNAEKDTKEKSYRRRKEYFIDYFVESSILEERSSALSILQELFATYKFNSKGKEIATSLYGLSLNEPLNQEFKVEQGEASYFIQLIYRLQTLYERRIHPEEERKEVVVSKEQKKRGRKRAATFYDYFYLPTMSDEEKVEVNRKVDSILSLFQSQEGYSTIFLLYGEDKRHLKEEVSISKRESQNLRKLISSIREVLEHPEKELVLSKSEKKLTEKQKVVAVEHNTSKISYLDAIVMGFYKEKDISSIAEMLFLSEKKIVKSLLTTFTLLEEKENLIELIVTTYPEMLSTLLNKEPFVTYMQSLSLVEQQIVYLRLLSVSQEKLTIAHIAEIAHTDSLTIMNYTIISDNPCVSLLNKYFTKEEVYRFKKEK